MPIGKSEQPGNTRGSKKRPDARATGNTPLTAYEQAKAEWLERMGTPIVEKNRWFLTAFILATALAMGAFSFTQILPLKSVQPFIIEVDRLTGETKASSAQAVSYQPQEREVRYFLAQWVRMLTEIGPSSPRDLQEAYKFVRATAVDSFKEYLQSSKVFAEMKRDPSLRRTIEISSITFIQEGVAMIRVVSTTKSTLSMPIQKRFIVKVDYLLDPPKTEAEIQSNPIGFFVTHFDFREELK